MTLESGFVLAVIVAALLIADRVGGSPELGRRFYQVALGATVAITVVAFTTAVIRPADDASTVTDVFTGGTSDSDGLGSLEDEADRQSARNMVRLGAGVVAIMAGLALTKRWGTLPLGFLLGGLILILFGSNADFAADYSSLFFAAVSRGSAEVDAVNFVVTAALTLVLGWYGYMEWERRGRGGGDDAAPLDDEDTAQ